MKMIEKDSRVRLNMGRPCISVSLSMLMLTSLLCIVPPVALADGPPDIVEPICNANRNDTWTVGLIYCDDRVNEDYTLFAPMSSASTYLIDSHGREIHSWTSSSGLRPGLSVYMLEDGDLLRTTNIGTDGGGSFNGGGIAGKIERLSWDSQIEWEWYYVGDSRRSHHDIEPLPNGNFLMIAWEMKSTEEAEQAGRDPDKMSQNQLWPDHIIEVEPIGTDQANIVWEWHIWDHLIQDFDSTMDNYGVVADHPELLDINFADAAGSNKYKSDWMHCNGIDYNPTLDQIALSCKNTNEIYIIDHSTTTEEAANHTGGNSGKGGDILYRWGNPEAYRAGNSGDQQLFAQHDIQWIQEGRPGEGNLIVFNNGAGGRGYSSVDVISPPLVNGEYVIQSGSPWGPSTPSWSWDQGTDMYATSLSGVERLENGNTLVTWGPRGTFYEVNLEGEIVWKYINPVIGDGPMNQGESIPQGQNANSQQNTVFKTHRYNSSFPGFYGKDLTPGDYIESWADNCNKEDSIPWDSDGDGCIDDTDGDGVKDNADICPGFDDSIDVDSDSIPDGCDDLVDSDQDGIDDSEDLCPGFDDSIDVDTDGIPDGCDDLLDSDGDGISDEDDACPGLNDNIDVDGDGIADGCDDLIDSDADGIADAIDACPGHDDAIDVDGDGIPDGCDPLFDSDDDGISNANDTCDGYDDAIDVDGDGLPDGCDDLIDSDADGVPDSEDLCEGNNDTMDQDGDGIPDDCDSTPMPVENNQTNGTDVSPPDDDDSSDVAADSNSTDSKMAYAVVAAIIGLLIVFIAAARLVFMRPPEDDIAWDNPPSLDVFASPVPEHYPPEQTQPVSALPQMGAVIQETQGPPLPESGLPDGWTMEQWQHYGQQYLDELTGHNNG